MNQWQLQAAKARMSDLVKQAQTQPQEITLHGRPAAVVISRREYDRLSGQHQSLVEFIQQSPLHGLDELEFPRDNSLSREVTL